MNERIGLISVIMAAYNAEKTISQAVESVLNQTYKDIELLIIDDCSTDATWSIIEELANKDQRIVLFRNEVNSGVSKTRYYGLQKAKGDWIAILDSDDAWKSDKLEKQIDIYKKTGAELIFTGSAFMDEDNNKLEWTLQVPKEIDYRQLLKQNLVSNSSVLIKKALYEKHYASGDEMHEDFATWLGVLRSGKKAHGINEPLLIYRVTKSSKSGNKLKSAKMNWNTYRYIGLNVLETAYYMAWYIVNGLLKYKNLR